MAACHPVTGPQTTDRGRSETVPLNTLQYKSSFIALQENIGEHYFVFVHKHPVMHFVFYIKQP